MSLIKPVMRNNNDVSATNTLLTKSFKWLAQTKKSHPTSWCGMADGHRGERNQFSKDNHILVRCNDKLLIAERAEVAAVAVR